MKRITQVNGITDCHTHCGGIDCSNLLNLRYPCTQHVNALCSEMKTNDVSYAITFPMPSTLYYNTRLYWEKGIFIPSGVEEIPYGLENIYLLNEVSAFNAENILPFVSFSVHDKIKEQCAHIRKWTKKYNIYGLKLHTLADQTDLQTLLNKGEDFLRLASDYNLPIIFHAENKGISEPLKIFDIAVKYSNVRFSMAHFAGLNKEFFRILKQYQKSFNNVFFDCAPCIHICSHYSSLDPGNNIMKLDYDNPVNVLAYFITEYHDNMLWGTDSPWLFASSIQQPIERIITYTDEKKFINFLNATRKMSIAFSYQSFLVWTRLFCKSWEMQFLIWIVLHLFLSILIKLLINNRRLSYVR